MSDEIRPLTASGQDPKCLATGVLKRVDQTWMRPNLSGLELEYRFTSSVVEDFAAGHKPTDVFRELVQNEYDAQGPSMDIAFGEDALRIIGSGKPIDDVGWNRLSVMMGTGRVAGSDVRIAEKVNDLGSKNFGVRSLFRFGDQIFIHSRGRMTVLDLQAGAPRQPLPDPASKRTVGVRIEVPYRTQPRAKLEPFTKEREAQMFDEVFAELSSTLVKLAQPGGRKDLRALTISSQRLGFTVRWRQSVNEERTRLSGYRILRRISMLEETRPAAEGESSRRSVRIEELEFQKIVTLPLKYKEQKFPGYFRLRGGKVRIAVSLCMNRHRIDLNHAGCYFYPLGALSHLTGTAVSVSAPFDMNTDRSQVIENDWNTWLLERAADAAIELLAGDWLARFEGDAYLALKSRSPETCFSKLVNERLRVAPCWPTRSRNGKRKQAPLLRRVTTLITDRLGDLDGFVNDESILEDRIRSGPELKEMAEACGAMRFGQSSLIRLRCAGDDPKALAGIFNVAREANYRYSNFPDALVNLERQRKFAAAIDEHWEQFSEAQRKVLKHSPTTLTAASTLAAPWDSAAPLWAVAPDLSPVCPAPATQRLHPELFEFKALRQLCRPFKIAEWVSDLIHRISGGKAREEERDALYRYVLSPDVRLDRKMRRLLHRCPILRDHRGAWTTPAAITLRNAAGAEVLEPILSFPHDEYASNIELARALRFRNKTDGSDLVRYAAVVAREAVRAEAFEVLLHRRLSSLSNANVEKLKQIPFLKTSLGTLALPTAVFVHSPTNLSCLGPGAPYTTANYPKLYERLGCRKLPTTVFITAYLDKLRKEGAPPPRPEVLYPALVEAVRRERVGKLPYERAPILWTQLGYQCPANTVLAFYRELPSGAVPRPLTSHAAVVDAYRDLGAATTMRSEHWGLVLTWLGRKYEKTGGPLSKQERGAAHAAYEHLAKLPDNVSPLTRYLLDREGFLHSTTELSAKHFVIDDDPPLARAVAAKGARLRFADVHGKTMPFLAALGVPRLTDLRRILRHNVGEERPLSKDFAPARLLAILHSENFCSALTALVLQRWTADKGVVISNLTERLRSYREVVCVASLEVVYEVAGTSISVAAEAMLDAGRVLVTRMRRTSEAFAPLAQLIAALTGATISEQRNLADAVYRLLTDASPVRMKAYLDGRGVPWSPKNGTDPLDEDEKEADTGAADEERELARSVISNALIETLHDSKADDEPDASPQDRGPEDTVEDDDAEEEIPNAPSSFELPDLDDVSVMQVDPAGTWTPPPRKKGGTRKGGGCFNPATRDAERDMLIGRRGEALVYREEIERIRALGHSNPEQLVIWTSGTNPSADHDIRSIDDDGETIWIEVKSTSGRDGQFYWGKAEFELALRKRARYVLCRVYDADTTQAFVKYLRDPLGRLEHQGIRLELGVLRGEVEPLET